MKQKGLLIWFFAIVILAMLFLAPSDISKTTKGTVLDFSKQTAKILSIGGRKTKSFVSIFFEIGRLRKENQNLANKIVELGAQESKLNEAEIENSRLKELLSYKTAHPEENFLIADVIGLDPTGFYDTILVNKGSNDGISTGLAVTSLGVLVGKVTDVWQATSKITLIISKDSIIQVMLQNSRTNGILRGGISGMVLDDIPLDTLVAENENIITSGLGGSLPKNIYVGTAEKEISVKSDIFKTIKIKSPIDFPKLEIVSIILN